MPRAIIAALLLALALAPAAAAEQAATPTLLIASPSAVLPPAPPDAKGTSSEIEAIKALTSRHDSASLASVLFWDAGGPTYRWNEMAVEEAIRRGVPTPLAGRHMALMHVAISDAMQAAFAAKAQYKRPRPSIADAGVATLVATPKSPSYPAEHAVAAGAASEVLAHIYPDRAEYFRAKAEEAARSRVLAGVQYPSDVTAGLALGRAVAAKAIERAKVDGTSSKWTGSVPQEQGKWRGSNPILPLAGTWKPWVLERGDQLRPPAPPSPASERMKADLAELKRVQRTPYQTGASWFWEHGAGGLRAFQFWNDRASRKLLEYRLGADPVYEALAYAAESVAFYDATVACFDAKYAYWSIRPFMLDPELKPLFPAPNHPSYPAAHGCLSTAAATVLARLFPRHAAEFTAMSEEAAEARVWAGIHFRADLDAGKALGRAVAEKVIAAFGIR